MTSRFSAFRIAVLALLFAAAGFFSTRAAADAAVSPAPCPGNVCTGTIVVGGQTVNYAFTEHVAPGGDLRIRLNGGVYTTTGLVSYIAYNLPSFSSWDKLANPTNGAVFLPIEDVNPGRTAYERRDNDGCAGCIVDQVMSVRYAALAPGAYDFDISVIQLGDTGGKTLRFYVDAAAPTNGNESAVWAALAGMDRPCADAVDNDLDYGPDCADAQCVGSVGNVGSGARCEQPEATCNDDFDNDADGRRDCLDPDCDGRVGQPAGTALCQYGNEFGASTCGDVFDNDADGWTDCIDNVFSVPAGGDANTICWKKPLFGCPATEISCTNFIDDDKDRSYNDAWDQWPLTGGEILASGQLRCLDYDCAGNAACPAQENKTATGADADAQCFNGVDDDLDHLIDCGDPDCLGIVNPLDPTRVCYDKEFDLGQRYQYCGNAFDDDGDGPQDCADSDCSRRFGNCGPCPAREDFTYDSCADAKDNDTDVTQNCADPDCAGELGSLGNAAMCGAENTNVACGDGFSNDNDVAVDCADPDCAGSNGPLGQACQPAGETSCANGNDNDGDGLIDCADPNCFGVASCAAKTWTNSSCQVVPRDTAPTPFTSNNPTVLATVRIAGKVGQPDIIRLQGSGTYSSITLIVGDNTDPAKYYPYADASPNCMISGPTAARFATTAIAGHAVQIYNTPGPDIASFDITLTCLTPPAPVPTQTYPLSLSALKQPGGAPEYGDLNMSTTLYEATKPVISEIETEGLSGGTVRLEYGATRRVRVVPNDPGGAAPLSSGICRCELTYNSVTQQTGPECITTPLSFTRDDSWVFGTSTEDGAGNVSDVFNLGPISFNVTPSVDTPLVITPAKPFFNASNSQATVNARFFTATNDTFVPPAAPGTCTVRIYDVAGTLVNGPPAIPLTLPGMPVGNQILCSGAVTLPSLADGTYSMAIRVRDDDTDTVDSNKQAFYVCNTIASGGDPEPTNGCQYADFDYDGASEGLFTTLYSTSPYACDNCVGLSNSLQTDVNANGIGDECEPGSAHGRCEVDRNIVCDYDSDEAPNCPGGALCCPGPSIGEEPPGSGLYLDPQRCLDVWGICSIGGQICFNDPQCTDGGSSPIPGYGLCQDGTTACKRDVDCGVVSGAPLCSGANICDNLLFPWLETRQGSLFSKKRITAPEAPPQNQYNATFCILAKDLIINFTSAQCGVSTDPNVKFERPKQSNAYTTVLGALDIAGLRAGKYGTLVVVPIVAGVAQLDATLDSYANRLGGRVFIVTGDATVSAHTIMNDAADGAGTVLIDGGDLTITGIIDYENAAVSSLDRLASIGWVVVPTTAGTKGNIYVDGSVTTISGAFYAGGDDGFWTVAPPTPDSPTPLTVNGLAVAKSFHFSRSFKSVDQGAERFIYDGRAVANTPPGFADVTKSLPLFTDSLPQ